MPQEEFGSSTRHQDQIISKVQQRTDRCPVEQQLSDQLIKLLGILKDVTPVYFSGYPPTEGGDYHHISFEINGDSPLIRLVRLLMHALTGRFVDGHLCFESKALRDALYAFCDVLSECSDPDDHKSLDKFEKELDQLINYFGRVREAIRNGEAVDPLDYCNEVTTRITSLIDILRNEVCETFVNREKEIRRAPGRSYRRPERAEVSDGFNAEDRATLNEIKSTVKSTRTDVSTTKKEAGAALYLQSNGRFGNDPALADFCSINKQTMVDFGFELILGDRDLTAPAAADLAMAHYPNLVGGYKAKYDEDRESLRQRIVRRSHLEGLDLKTNRKYAS